MVSGTSQTSRGEGDANTKTRLHLYVAVNRCGLGRRHTRGGFRPGKEVSGQQMTGPWQIQGIHATAAAKFPPATPLLPRSRQPPRNQGASKQLMVTIPGGHQRLWHPRGSFKWCKPFELGGNAASTPRPQPLLHPLASDLHQDPPQDNAPQSSSACHLGQNDGQGWLPGTLRGSRSVHRPQKLAQFTAVCVPHLQATR